MTEKTLNWGIIGCGDVTEIKSGPAFGKVANSRLIAVMRRNAEKAEDYAKRHHVPKWYSNAYDLIADQDVNAIYIATPPSSHEEYVIAALKAGKPVYVEKPMTIDTAAALKIQQAAEQTNTKITVAHYRRALPLFKTIKSLLAEKAIGDVRFVRMEMSQPHNSSITANTEENWRVSPDISGGGLFHDLAPHQLDLMVYFFGEYSIARGLALNQGQYYAADDFVMGEILFSNNIAYSGTWCFTIDENNTKDLCEIYGSEGKISFSVFGHYYILSKQGNEERVDFQKPQHIQQPMIEEVTAYFLNYNESNPCSVAQGVKVMRLLDAFTRSSI